jgi:hypothetical protein
MSESWKVYAGMQDVWKMQRCDEHSKHAFAVGCVRDVLCVCVCVCVGCLQMQNLHKVSHPS